MSDTGIDPDDVGDIVDAGEAAVAGAIGAAACLACGEKVSGRFCYSCGQRHDAMRRNVFALFWDYLRETFDFDSRMWRTALSLFTRPGMAAREYSHGARSRYTPPIRMFLFVSFLFFLTLSLTHTYFAAFDVRYGEEGAGINFTVGEEAEMRAAIDEARAGAAEARKDVAASQPEDQGGVYVGGDADQPAARPKIDRSKCPTGAEIKFFVKASDIRPARDDLAECVTFEREEGVSADQEKVLSVVERGMRGAAAMAADPETFNAAINDWIPRIMFLMTPVLALILSIFFRGRKDALLFDNVLQSLHLHAALFVIVGAAIIAAQLGAPFVGPVTALAVAAYVVAALKNGYRRGWIKTIWSASMASLLYFIVLSSAVGTIVSRVVYDAG